MSIEIDDPEVIALASNIVAAYVSKNTIVPENVPAFFTAVHAALSASASNSVAAPQKELVPAISIKKSVTPEFIICLFDGKKFRSLKRHLRTHYDMSPEQYREHWNLPHDYPMVSPLYAAQRSELAKAMGLGQRRQQDSITKPTRKKA
jgi:predicted transcriptional regulator